MCVNCMALKCLTKKKQSCYDKSKALSPHDQRNPSHPSSKTNIRTLTPTTLKSRIEKVHQHRSNASRSLASALERLKQQRSEPDKEPLHEVSVDVLSKMMGAISKDPKLLDELVIGLLEAKGTTSTDEDRTVITEIAQELVDQIKNHGLRSIFLALYLTSTKGASSCFGVS